MDEAYQHTIEVIQKELKKQGMSQRQLALKTDTTPPSLSRMLKGKSVPTVSYVGKLAQALGKQLKLSFIPPDNPDLDQNQ
jgi:transcriptional regulator with XRE-family HTH domain